MRPGLAQIKCILAAKSFETRLVYNIDGGAFSAGVYVWPGGQEGAALGIRV